MKKKFTEAQIVFCCTASGERDVDRLDHPENGDLGGELVHYISDTLG
jgi:hypothetical protein